MSVTPDEMAERCTKCSNPKVLCLYGANSLARAAIKKEKEACAALAKSMIGARPREIAEAIRTRHERKEEQ